MSSGRVVIAIDDDNVGNTTENQVQRLVRELNEARTTIAYLRVDLASSQAENAHLQAKTARFQAKFARLRAQLEVELFEDPDEESQPRPNAPGNGGRQLRRFRGSHQETRPPKRPRTETQDPVGARRELLTNSADSDRLDDHEEADEKITVRVNQDGNLESDSELDGQAWSELEDAWQAVKRQFDRKSSSWASIDLKKRCVWSIVVSAPTTHYWTREQPGNFACRSCANKRRICVGWVGGRLQLLPLPPVPESAKHTVTNLVSNFVAETENISPRALQTTKSARVCIKAESDKMEKPFVFTGKGEVKFSADGNLIFAGTGIFTKAKDSNTGLANSDTATLTPSQSSTHLDPPPVPILRTNGQTNMVLSESQPHMTTAASGGNQLMHSGKNLSVSASMTPTNSKMSSQATGLGPGISSTNAASNKTDTDIAKPLVGEGYTPEKLAALREKSRQRFARIDQRLAALGENGKVAKRAKTIKDIEVGRGMAKEMNGVLDAIEAGFCDETRASIAKYKKHETLVLRRYDLIVMTSCEVAGPQAGRDRLNEILQYNVPLTYEEAMTIRVREEI
ncbi:hypothetical protein KCU64_g4356, partial [Aureobasidium melanogenum]